jgi:peroxiredoxin
MRDSRKDRRRMNLDPYGIAFENALRRASELDAPLAGRLAFYAEECRRIAPECATAWHRLSDRLTACGAGSNGPGPGDVLPAFALRDECGLFIGLDELLREGPLAIVFHLGHWCPFSRLNGMALAGAQELASAVGGRIIAITPDRRRYASMLNGDSLGRVRVLTDPHNGYALTLGVAVWLGLDLQRILSERGTNLPSFQGNEAWMVPLPATYVVGAGGRIVARHVPFDFRGRMPIDDLLSSLKSAGKAFFS